MRNIVIILTIIHRIWYNLSKHLIDKEVAMAADWIKDIHFERCPKCSAVVMFKKGEDTSTCQKCGAKIKLQRTS